jgi:hypothetical protein
MTVTVLVIIILLGGLYIFKLNFKGEGAGFKIEASH